MNSATFPTLLLQFFSDRLCTQMQASQNTISGYRDTFSLLLQFTSIRLGKAPTKLRIEELGKIGFRRERALSRSQLSGEPI